MPHVDKGLNNHDGGVADPLRNSISFNIIQFDLCIIVSLYDAGERARVQSKKTAMEDARLDISTP
jgi:hypothetical protein